MALSPETLDFIKQYQVSAPAPAAGTDDGGITDHILWTLGLLTRPSKAVWTGIDEATRPEGNIWEGVKRGWYDRPGAKEAADVFGLPEAQSTDDWLPWLRKSAARIGVNTLGDPLTYAFAPAKAAGIAKSGIGLGPALLAAGIPEGKSIAGTAAKALGSDALAEAFYGSSIGKVLKSGLPKTDKYQPIREKWWEIEREGSKIPIQEEAAKAQKLLDDAIKGTDYTYADVYHALERPNEVGPDLARIADLVRPLQEAKDTRFNVWNTLKENLDQETTGSLTGKGYVHMPHNVTDEQLLRLRKVGDVDLATDAFKQGGREIKRFYVGDKPLLDEMGQPLVGKISDPRTQEAIRAAVSKLDLGSEAGQASMFPDIEAMTRISPTWRDLVSEAPATLRDILPIMPKGSLVDNPVEALTTALTNRQGQINTLKLLDYLRGENLLWHTGKNMPEHLLSGARQLQIPGFETWATTPQIANWLENLAGVPTDWLGKSLQKARQTPMGQGLEDLTQWWKRNTLALAPSYWTGNVVSDSFNRYMAGQNPGELFGRMGQAYHTLAGGDPALLRELQIRGLPVSSWAGSLAEEGTKAPSRLRDMAESIPGLNKIMDAAGYASEKLRDLNQGAFKYGNMLTEAPGRVATALDYLAKEAPNFRDLPADQYAKALDAAAAFSKEKLVNYGAGGLTATQRELQRLLVPFAGWQFGMPALFAQQLVEHPERLARVSRTLDTAFMPMTDQDRAVMDPYIQENAPVRGVAGWQFPTDDKGVPQIMQLARYLPWGNIEGMVNRPAANTWASVNPWLKAPTELALNYSAFKGGPIDTEAKGFGQSLTAPLTGEPYQQSRAQYLGQNIPAGYEEILKQSPAGRNTQAVNDILRSLGFWEDPNKAPTSPAAAVTAFATGGKFNTYDIEAQRKHRQREYTETEKAIRSNMKSALGKMDTEGYQFYLNQLLDHVGKKAQKLGYSTPGA